jgi:hypothetical protein
VQPFRRTREALLVGNGDEVAHVAQFHCMPFEYGNSLKASWT